MEFPKFNGTVIGRGTSTEKLLDAPSIANCLKVAAAGFRTFKASFVESSSRIILRSNN